MKTDTMGGYSNYELWMLFNQASYVAIRSRERELGKLRIARMHAAVLFILKTAKVPVTPAEISRWLFRAPHTASTLVDRMAKKGLVTKRRDLEKKNLVRVEITKKGEEAYQRVMEIRSVDDIFAGLTKRERESLRKILQKLRDRSLVQLGLSLEVPYPPRK